MDTIKSDRTKHKDRILYCERCGISFLFPIEEQKAANAPTRCAGCRKLLPGPDRERGLVKWFNRRHRYGFISRKRGAEIFVHGSNVEGRRKLRPGDLVEFSTSQGKKGLMATGVKVLSNHDKNA